MSGLFGPNSSKKANMQRSGRVGLPGQTTPWVDPGKQQAAQNAGIAGRMLHGVLQRSRSTGIKIPGGRRGR